MKEDPTTLIDPIVKEAKRTLREMKKSQDLNERRTHSEIALNLCRCLGVFFEVMDTFMDHQDLPDDLSDMLDNPFASDE